MGSDYDEIINMTNEEAADIITNILLNVTVARGSAKSMTSLRTNQALILAISALKRGDKKLQMLIELDNPPIDEYSKRPNLGLNPYLQHRYYPSPSIEDLQGLTESLDNGDITPNMARVSVGLTPLNGSDFENGPYINKQLMDEYHLGGKIDEI